MDLFGEPDAPEKESPPAEETHDLTGAPEEEGLQHPRFMNVLYGHDSFEQNILEQFNSGRMPHGLILNGPKGIGKATAAYRVARFLLKHGVNDPNQPAMFDDAPAAASNMDVDREDQVFKLVSSGAHPDLLTLEPEYDAAKNQYKDNIAVAEIRKVNPFLRMTASYGGWRIVIVDDADTMNRNAQNALLKILEEPPNNTVLMLITHRLGAMIPTIRSRTQLHSFQPLSQDTFTNILTQNGYDVSANQIEALYKLSEGSVGKALQHIENGGLDTLALLLAMFENYPRFSWPDIHTMADQLARSGRDQSYNAFAELLPWIYRQMITAKARGHALNSEILQQNAIQTLHKQSSLESLLKICENLEEHFITTKRANLDKRQAVLNAFSMIAA